MKDFMAIAKALADDNRVRILMFLRHGELCVCQIIEMLQLAPSTVSKHLAILRSAELIDSAKRGRWIYYRLADEPSDLVASSHRWVFDSLEGTKQAHADDADLVRVKKTCLEELCNHYSNGNRAAA